jgi:hypothetical protein
MSVVRSCMRLCTIAALRDRTWAENRVFDSDNAPLDQSIKEQPTPYVVVFTDDDEHEEIQGFDFVGSQRDMLIIIEFGLAAAITIDDERTIRIPATDGGFEIALDMLERQIIHALLHDPFSAWGELWRGLAMKLSQRASSKRGGSAEGGARWAARQLLLHVDTFADPPAGVVLPDNHPIRQFIAAARISAIQGMPAAAELIEASLATVPISSWRQAQAWLGLTEFAARGLGLGPPVIPQEPLSTTTGLGSDDTGMVEEHEVSTYVGDAEPKEPPPSGIPWPDPLTLPNKV